MSSVFIGSLASSLFPQTSTTSLEGSSTVHPGPISPLMTSAPVAEISEGVYTLNIKITANPHQRALSVSWIAEMYDVPHLASSISHMLELDDNSTLAQLWEYNIEQLPLSYWFLDIWSYFCLAVPRINELFDDKYISVYCRPAMGGRPAHFTPVYVKTNPAATGIHCMSIQLCLFYFMLSYNGHY